MIAACPRCGARYRIERHRVRPEGVRVRCSRCQAVFRVRAPSAPSAATRPEPPATRPPPPVRRDRSRLVVVADADPERAKRTATVLTEAGLEVVLAHDGVEAILAVQRVLPRAVVLDAGLPKMFGFQICELMKRNESLRSILVLLVGSTHHPDRYRRAPSDLYGADCYLDDTALSEGLLRELARLGVTRAERATLRRPTAAGHAPAAPGVRPEPPARSPATRTRPPASAPKPRVAEAHTPARPPAAPVAGPGDTDEIAKAERLARIIVSDIVLYNEEKFARAVSAGNVLEAMADELAEGRNLFGERVGARLREQRDFLSEEMLRVARARGAR
jgi:predicted Zn finger-like uncharacterized protein